MRVIATPTEAYLARALKTTNEEFEVWSFSPVVKFCKPNEF